MPRATSKAELAWDDDLARGLRRARLAAGIGFREAAQRAKLDQTSIWRIETGRFNPTISTTLSLMKLYEANLNVGPDGVMLTWMEEPTEGGT